MCAWEMTRRGPDAGAPEECAYGVAETSAAVAAGGRTAMPEERALRPGGQSSPAAELRQVLDLAGGIRRQRDEARLVELELADRQRALRRVVGSDGQLDVRTTLPVRRRVCSAAAGAPQPVSCDLGGASSTESRTGAIERHRTGAMASQCTGAMLSADQCHCTSP